MVIETVAILSPGDMGHAVGQLLREHELKVVTCLTGRSQRTKDLAELAGIADVPDLNDMVAQSQIILSISVSEMVPSICQQVADAIKATNANVLFAECNAISPQLSRQMEPIITEAGGRYIDASIVGGPPLNGSSPRFYASGDNTAEFEGLANFGLDVRTAGTEVGQASGIKMCYAAMTKGSSALYSELLMAAEMMGLSDFVKAEFQSSQPAVLQRMERGLPGVPAKARRWVSEMEEIKDTFEHLGLTPHLFQGVADMYRMIGSTSMGDETPQTRDGDRSLEETIRLMAEWVQAHPK
ncbi:MAG TPA: 6-phosphogluconate dehydrogenase [Dehalococcoidia bacterium]|nr:6-phosphogluconate dehydrogenase [Dehalococcoidia bacterium]